MYFNKKKLIPYKCFFVRTEISAKIEEKGRNKFVRILFVRSVGFVILLLCSNERKYVLCL